MVLSLNSFRVNTALALKNILRSYADIDHKFQLGFITVSAESLQQEGQEFLPKTENSGKLKNWGFPKGCKSHCHSQEGRWTNKVHGNGVSVVWDSFRLGERSSKGKQLTGFLYLLAGNKVNYTSSTYRNAKLEADREIRCSYDQLFDIELYKTAYNKLKSNPGNMTPGTDGSTLDGISKDWAENVIRGLKDRTYQFQPSLRVYIPKANGKLIPLGIPSPRDKIVQQAIRMILESKFEPLFLDSSHGFRPKRSTHSAIFEIRKWNGITWMIEGDIKGYFDNIDHKILEELLKREIKDQNLIDLYWKLVNAGYINDGNYVKNNLGVPQGGVLSPLLSNIYLHEFDKFMATLQEKYTDFSKRVSRPNSEYNRLRIQLNKLRSLANTETVKDKERYRILQEELTQKLRITPSVIRDNSTGTRLYYNRYADDWLIGISGSAEMATQVKDEVSQFLHSKLNLTLSEDKTKITHIVENKVNYLGFQISRRSRLYTESQLSLVKSTGVIRRPSYASMVIEAPIEKLISKLVNHGFATMNPNTENKTVIGKVTPKSVTKWIFMKPQDILLRYNAIIRGILNYYYPVENRNQFSYLLWIFKFSAAFTFARKWNISPKKVWRKLGNPLTVVFKGKKENKAISLYEPLTLKKDRTFKLQDYHNFDPFSVKYFAVRSHHIWDEECLLCGATYNIVMHHVKHIRKGKGTGVTQIMRQLNRKQIAVCKNCHNKIHAGKYDGTSL
jgi:group II intron reverse transcriptase/maturase